MRPSFWLSVCALGLAALWAGTARAGGARQEQAFADEAIGLMKQSAQAVRSKIGAARSSKDVVQTACLTEKLTQLEVVQRQAEDARSSLRRASLREDMDAIQQSSASMTRLDARARELRREADQCVGQDVSMVAGMRDARVESSVEVESARNQLDQAIAGAQVSVHGAPPAKRVSAREPDTVAFLSANAPASTPAPATPAAPFAPTPAPSGSPYATEATHEATMLAYSADLTLAVFQVDRSLASVESLARELGGYLAQRSDAQVTVKVPRPRFDEAMSRIAKMGDVLHRNVAAEDVTDEYVDLELRLKNARAMRDQLAELLKGAAVKDAVEIEKELAKVTEVIEQIEGRLKVLRDKIGFSSITVSFQANAPSPVRSNAILPFTWLDSMGLESLLNVPKVSP
jgi:hypothetical protein